VEEDSCNRQRFALFKALVMMMIAFIDFKRSSFIIFIEALCILDSSSRFYDHIFGFESRVFIEN